MSVMPQPPSKGQESEWPSHTMNYKADALGEHGRYSEGPGLPQWPGQGPGNLTSRVKRCDRVYGKSLIACQMIMYLTSCWGCLVRHTDEGVELIAVRIQATVYSEVNST